VRALCESLGFGLGRVRTRRAKTIHSKNIHPKKRRRCERKQRRVGTALKWRIQRSERTATILIPVMSVKITPLRRR